MRKMRKRRGIALIIGLIQLLIVLSSCGSTAKDIPEPTATVKYLPEYIAVSEELRDIQLVVYNEGKLFLAAYGVIGKQSVEYNPDEIGKGAGSVTYSSGSSVAISRPSGASGDGQDSEAETESETAAQVETYEIDVYGTLLYSVNTDGTDLQKLPEYEAPKIPDGKQGNVNLNGLSVDADGTLVVLESIVTYDTDMDAYMQGTTQILLRKLDSNGAVLSQLDISEISEEAEYFYIRGMAVDSAGNTIISREDNAINIVTPEGKITKLELSGWIQNMIRIGGGDGRVGVQTYENQNSVLKMIDCQTQQWAESISLDWNIYNLYSGDQHYAYYYYDNSNFYAYDLPKKEAHILFNWIDCDINSDNLRQLVVSDMEITCFINDYRSDTQTLEMVRLEEKELSPEQLQKTVLTLAAIYLSNELRTAVIDFNKRTADCRIEVVDYSIYNTSDDYNAGLMKMGTEIISGKIPDIISVNSQMPLDMYASKGLLEDLYPFIDNDTVLSRSDLISDVFNALDDEGKLYQITSNFSVLTVVGRTDVVGNKSGWTFDEMMSVFEDSGAEMLFPNMFREDFLNYVTYMNMANYVDWDKGQCYFDSDEFIKLLNAAKEYFPERPDYNTNPNYYEDMESEPDLLQSGRAMLSYMNIYDFRSIQMYKAMFGADLTFIGLPNSQGTNGSMFVINSGLALSSKCANKDKAWDFMRRILSEDFQNADYMWNFPINRNSFDLMVEKSMEKQIEIDENGEEIEYSNHSWGWGSFMIDIYATSPDERDLILDLIRNTTTTANYDETIVRIITEELKPFFAGEKSAEDTASIIQSMVTIYVNEQS